MAKCPKTAEEAFKKLDKLLSEEEKEAIRNAEDMVEYHFGLGMWIRNQWIYRQEDENLAMLLKDIGVDIQMLSDINPNIPEGDHFPLFFMHPDSMSSYILEAYQKYLKEKIKKEEIAWQKALKGELKIRPNCFLEEDEEK